jgi:hypothetical protein
LINNENIFINYPILKAIPRYQILSTQINFNFNYFMKIKLEYENDLAKKVKLEQQNFL